MPAMFSIAGTLFIGSMMANRRMPFLTSRRKANSISSSEATSHEMKRIPVVRNCSGVVGQASAIKMLRSVMIKGLEALTAECILAARRAGVEAQVLASLLVRGVDLDDGLGSETSIFAHPARILVVTFAALCATNPSRPSRGVAYGPLLPFELRPRRVRSRRLPSVRFVAEHCGAPFRDRPFLHRAAFAKSAGYLCELSWHSLRKPDPRCTCGSGERANEKLPFAESLRNADNEQ